MGNVQSSPCNFFSILNREENYLTSVEVIFEFLIIYLQIIADWKHRSIRNITTSVNVWYICL